MPLTKSQWHGDYTGEEILSDSVSCYYNTIEGETPYNNTQDSYGVYSPGDEFTPRTTLKSGETIHAFVNGKEYPVVGTGPCTLTGAPAGFLTINYVPSLSLLRLNFKYQAIDNYALVTKPIVFKALHINEIIQAIHTAQNYTGIPLTRFNMSETALSDQVFSLVENSEIMSILFNDIESAILGLYNKATHALPDIFEGIDTMTLNAEMIEAIRSHINIIEEIDWDSILGA